MTDSHIEVSSGSTTFVGQNATRLFQATVIRHAIDFYVQSGMKVNRSYTPTRMLAVAAEITGNTYKRTELKKASADLATWIEAAKATIPVISR